MGTLVTIEVLRAEAEEAIDRAFDWFRTIEACCTRFDPASELMQLTSRVGMPVEVSPMLFELVQFALAVATESGGAFDPTIGREMEARGFNREYSTGRVQRTDVAPDRPVSFRDVEPDPERRTITLRQPLVLDLGAVAKGLAIDTAARELQPFADFAIDAGGDLYLGGHNASHDAWSVGIRHPRLHDQTIETIQVSDKAVCTSGDYERREGRADDSHHLLDPRTRGQATLAASATVVAPAAVLADALATAAFVLGPDEGIRLLTRVGVEGMILSAALDRHATQGFGRA